MIHLHDVAVEYGSSLGPTFALQNADLTIGDEFLGIVGPSGCGKTTLLRVLAGLVEPTRGFIESDLPRDSSYGVVFQDYSLLPWLTARDNIELGLRLRHLAPAECAEISRQLLHELGLADAAHLLPHQLSGGMRQRVAIGRALAPSPLLLLMDEPFGALDAITRTELQEALARVSESGPRTVVFVTHDVEESLFLCDRICVLSNRPGRVRTTIQVPFARPRQHSIKRDGRFLDLKEHVESILRAEAKSLSADGASNKRTGSNE